MIRDEGTSSGWAALAGLVVHIVLFPGLPHRVNEGRADGASEQIKFS